MSPREKTRAHMKKLVAVAALAAGCSKKTDPGYGVVDPMPPPAQCPGTSSLVTAKASFFGADLLLELDFSRSSGKARAGAASWDGAVVAEEITGDFMRVRVRRPAATAGIPAATAVTVSVPVDCGGPHGQLVARLTWTSAPPAGPPTPDDAGLPARASGPPTSDAGGAITIPVTVTLHDQ